MDDEALDTEVGLQNERTVLAWRRTALACVAVGVLVARGIGGRAGLVVLVVVLGGVAAVGALADRRYLARSRWADRVEPVAAPGDVALMAALVVGLGVLGLIAVVT